MNEEQALEQVKKLVRLFSETIYTNSIPFEIVPDAAISLCCAVASHLKIPAKELKKAFDIAFQKYSQNP